jgi:hypothetical protein
MVLAYLFGIFVIVNAVVEDGSQEEKKSQKHQNHQVI